MVYLCERLESGVVRTKFMIYLGISSGVMSVSAGASRPTKARLAICWFFFAEGCTLGNFSGILPTIKIEQNLSNPVLGAIFVAAIGGALLALPVVSIVTNKYGSGKSLITGGLTLLLLFPTIGIRLNTVFYSFSVFFLGFAAGWADVSMNAQAVLYEKTVRLPSLGLFHSIFAIGGLFGAVIGGSLISSGFNTLHETMLLCGMLFVPQLLFNTWLYSLDEEKFIENTGLLQDQSHREVELSQNPSSGEIDEEIHNTSNALNISAVDSDEVVVLNKGSVEETSNATSGFGPSPGLLYVTSALCFLSYLGEGSVGDWSAIYLSDTMSTSPFISTMGLVGYQLCLAIFTYSSDHFAHWLGRKTLLIVSGIIAASGLVLVVLSPIFKLKSVQLVSAIIGFSIFGMGISVVPPSVISIAGSSINGMSHNDAIAIVSSVGYVGIMVGPPLLGGLSRLFNGLQYSFLVDAGLMSLISIVACALPGGIANYKKSSSN